MKRFLRWISIFLLGLLILGLVAAGLSAIDNRSIFPLVPQQADRLDITEAAQITEVLHLLGTEGNQAWPGFGQSHTLPLLVGNDANVFLIGVEQALPGWQQVEGQMVAGYPVYSRPVSSMGGKLQAFVTQYNDSLVPSFYTYRTSSNQLINGITGMLPSFVRAIIPYRLFLQIFMPLPAYETAWVHESFHAFQARQAPQRFDQIQARYTHGNNYPVEDDALNQAWAREIDLLVRAAKARTDADARQLARQFLAAREARRKNPIITRGMVQFERDAEWLEGLAKYTELATGRVAGEDSSHYTVLKMAGFQDYRVMKGRFDQQLSQARNMQAEPGDGRFYYTGFDQAVLLDRLLPDWKSRILIEDIALEDLLAEAVK